MGTFPTISQAAAAAPSDLVGVGRPARASRPLNAEYRYREDRLATAAHRASEREKTLAYNETHPRDRKPLPRLLSTTTINKTLVLLGSILAVAEERGLIDRNPLTVNPQRRKAKRERRRPVYLDSAEHVRALLAAARDLDEAPDALTGGRRALVATLALAGLRLGEACGLDWARREPRDRLALCRLEDRRWHA